MNVFPGLDFSEVEGRLLATHKPVTEPTELDIATTRRLLVRGGYERWVLFEDAIATLVQRVNRKDGAFELTLGECRDGNCEIEIAPDSMVAWLSLKPPQGGKPVAPEAILLALDQSGVIYGIDEPHLREACKSTVPVRVAVAKGMAPQNGEDSRFEVLASVTRDRTPKVNEMGLIDYRETGEIPVVAAGQPLIKRHPATPGLDGRNVFGTLIEAQPGRTEKFPDNLIGVCLSDKDPNLLQALFGGHPVRVGNAMMVEQIARFDDANMVSGNIAFEGTVHIAGEVLQGMKVHASGDIVVKGTIDGGILNAGGDIHVSGGIIAHAKISAMGSVTARFVENSHIEAGTFIAVADMALMSHLQAVDQIVIGIKSPRRGRLIGGSARATMLIQTPILGATMSQATDVLVGVNPKLLAQHRDLLQRLEKQREETENLQKLIQHLTTQSDKAKLVESLASNLKHSQGCTVSLMHELSELRAQLALVDGAKLVIGVGVFGLVNLTFGQFSRRLTRPFDAGFFAREKDLILFSQNGGEAIEI